MSGKGKSAKGKAAKRPRQGQTSSSNTSLTVESMKRMTKEGRLVPAKSVVAEIILHARTTEEKRDVLMGQVAIARQRGATGRRWLDQVARDADALGLETPEWISENVYVLPRRQVVPADLSLLEGNASKDWRLKEDPNLPRRVEDAAEPSTSKEKLLESGSEESEDDQQETASSGLDDKSFDEGSEDKQVSACSGLTMSMDSSKNIQEVARSDPEETEEVELSEGGIDEFDLTQLDESLLQSLDTDMEVGQVSPSAFVGFFEDSDDPAEIEVEHENKQPPPTPVEKPSVEAARSSKSSSIRCPERKDERPEEKKDTTHRSVQPSSKGSGRGTGTVRHSSHVGVKRPIQHRYSDRQDDVRYSSPVKHGRQHSDEKRLQHHSSTARRSSPMERNRRQHDKRSRDMEHCERYDRRDTRGEKPISSQPEQRRSTHPVRDRGSLVSEGGKSTKLKEARCPIPWCTQLYGYPKAHFHNFHFPTKIDKQAGLSERSHSERLRALEFLASQLVGQGATIDDLLKYLNRSGAVDNMGNTQVDGFTDSVVMGLARQLGLVAPLRPSLNPLNTPGCIFHWKVLQEVLRRLSVTQHHQFMRLFHDPSRNTELAQRVPPVDEEPSVELEDLCVCVEQDQREVMVRHHKPPVTVSSGESRQETTTRRRSPSPVSSGSQKGLVDLDDDDDYDPEGAEEWEEAEPQALDGHFHIDRLGAQVGVSRLNLQAILNTVYPHRPEDQVVLRGAVAVFCDPESYPTHEEIQRLRGEGVVTAIGLHPCHAARVKQPVIDQIVELVALPEVVGLGEIGLDDGWDIGAQRRVLRLLLPHLQDRHVLVLHCRARDPRNRSACFLDLFEEVKARVSTTQRIHLHCFNGSQADVDRWSGHFVNVHYGYSEMVTRRDFGDEAIAALRALDTGKLLLETDAPYFPHHGYAYSSPAFLGMTATSVGRIRDQSRQTILRETEHNGLRLYWR